MAAWFPIDITGKPTAPNILAAAGIQFATRDNVDSVWVADQAAADAAQALVDAYDPLPVAKAEAKRRIRDEAGFRTRQTALEDQLGILGAAIKIIAKSISSTLSQAERNRLQALNAEFVRLDAIRDARAAAEAEIDALATVDDCAAYNQADPAKWP